MKECADHNPNECRVLWYAAIGFFLLFSAWTALFTIAAHHRVAEVPLATAQTGS
jgi:hypothetical protein